MKNYVDMLSSKRISTSPADATADSDINSNSGNNFNSNSSIGGSTINMEKEKNFGKFYSHF